MDHQETSSKINVPDIPLTKDLFLCTLIRELAGTLQQIVGLREAEGYISIVGHTMGDWINRLYKKKYNTSKLDQEQVIHALMNLKKQIGGKFYIIEKNEEKIVFGNHTCPFDQQILNRPCICMVTSNVFGSITAANLGYAKVELDETIAKGDKQCKVIVYHKRSPAADKAHGREYFQITDEQ